MLKNNIILKILQIIWTLTKPGFQYDHGGTITKTSSVNKEKKEKKKRKKKKKQTNKRNSTCNTCGLGSDLIVCSECHSTICENISSGIANREGSAQSEQGLHCPLKESLAIAEHYENKPIQIYRKFYLQKLKKSSDKKNLICFIFLLKT